MYTHIYRCTECDGKLGGPLLDGFRGPICPRCGYIRQPGKPWRYMEVGYWEHPKLKWWQFFSVSDSVWVKKEEGGEG